MAEQLINVGTTAGDNTGDPLRTAFQKVDSDIAEIFGAENLDTLTGGPAGVTISPSPDFNTYVDLLLTSSSVPVTLTGGASGRAQKITLRVKQDATGGRSLAFMGTNVRSAGGGKITPTPAPNAVDYVDLLTYGDGMFDIVSTTVNLSPLPPPNIFTMTFQAV